MRRLNPVSRAAAAAAVAAMVAMLLPSGAAAQAQKSAPAPQAASPKPYKPLAVTLPAPVNDPSFDAFRKEVVGVAQRKDRAALSRMVVAKGFFWEREDGKRAPKKSSIDILAQALNLAAKDGSGWEALAGFGAEPTAAPLPERKDVLCAPANPEYDERGLEELAQTTDTDPLEWGYPLRPDVDVRETPSATAPAIEKLGMHFVRVMPDTAPNASQEMMRIVTPSGKVGFVAAEAVSPLGSDQLCYGKDASGAWKIVGMIGGE